MKTRLSTMLRSGAAAVLLAVATLSPTTASAVEWKLGHILPPDHPANRALEAAAKEIAGKIDYRRVEFVGPKVSAELFRSGDIWKIYDKWMSTINMPASENLKLLFAMQAIPR